MRFPISALFVAGVVAPGAIAQAQAPSPEPPGLDDRAAAYHAFILGRSLDREGEIEEAVAAYRRAAELDPASSGIWAELAGLYARRNRPDEAIEAGNEALDRNAGDREAHRTLGLVYAARVESREAPAQSDVDLAIDHLAQARNPGSSDLMLSITLGRLYLSTRQPEPAVEVLTDMLDRAPQFADGQALLGRAHEALDQWDEAAAAYERAVLYAPRRARYRRRLADALANAGRVGRAVEVLEDLVRLRPDDADAWYRLATLELDAGDFDAAEAAARRVVELAPGDLRGAYTLSRALGGKRRYREMAEVLVPVVERARGGGVRSPPARRAPPAARVRAAERGRFRRRRGRARRGAGAGPVQPRAAGAARAGLPRRGAPRRGGRPARRGAGRAAGQPGPAAPRGRGAVGPRLRRRRGGGARTGARPVPGRADRACGPGRAVQPARPRRRGGGGPAGGRGAVPRQHPDPVPARCRLRARPAVRGGGGARSGACSKGIPTRPRR